VIARSSDAELVARSKSQLRELGLSTGASARRKASQ
jgi:hypothetical protein